ncbi:MAG TPA: STAS/SEC14 domain-containing protein [Microvirga sp.]|nr:STAS/SEC14 domain-containing protein [Microvirga sp.]
MEDRNGIVHVRASGRLTNDDYRRFTPEFDRVAGVTPPSRLLIELVDFRGWTLSGLWEELKFDIAHRSAFGAIAIVGDKRWQEWGTRLTAPFFGTKIRFFRPHEREDAWHWLGAALPGSHPA